MTISFVIEGRLSGLNDMIAADRNNRYGGGALKKKETRRCALACSHLPKIRKPVTIRVSWIEPNARRDIDNVCGGGQKFLMDGLVASGILPNDTREWVRGISHSFPPPDKKNPRIVVTIEEVNENVDRN